jgi:hypothetical protein
MLEFIHDGEPLDNLSSTRSLRQSIRQHSHIRLTEEEYGDAIRALEARGASGA